MDSQPVKASGHTANAGINNGTMRSAITPVRSLPVPDGPLPCDHPVRRAKLEAAVEKFLKDNNLPADLAGHVRLQACQRRLAFTSLL